QFEMCYDWFSLHCMADGWKVPIMVCPCQPTRGAQCGFELFTRDAARDIFRSLHLNRWALDSEIVLLARFMSLRMVEVQYPQLPSMLSQPACKRYETSPT
ncbi:hypothetical protein Pmar_PMAR020771, partial [Perkinsus marinus ATCC 50983]